MLKDHYVIGACINAYTNKAMLHALNINNIDLVIMCDDYIYDKYVDILSIYFDKVKKYLCIKYQ